MLNGSSNADTMMTGLMMANTLEQKFVTTCSTGLRREDPCSVASEEDVLSRISKEPGQLLYGSIAGLNGSGSIAGLNGSMAANERLTDCAVSAG